MRRALVIVLFAAAATAVACESTSDSGSTGPTGIHPQPQPNRQPAKFTSPCTATKCGEAPNAIERPSCKPLPQECGWTDDDTSVSFRQCPESDCGEAPGAEVCPDSTQFRGNICGSENEAPCAWHTTCVPPPSTTPCDPNRCPNEIPGIGLVCDDGGVGRFECMQFEERCNWQATCD